MQGPLILVRLSSIFAGIRTGFFFLEIFTGQMLSFILIASITKWYKSMTHKSIFEICKILPSKFAVQLHTGEILYFDEISWTCDESSMMIILNYRHVYVAFYTQCKTLRPWVKFRVNIPGGAHQINYEIFLHKGNEIDFVNRIFENEGKIIVNLKKTSQLLSRIFELEIFQYYEIADLPINCLYQAHFSLYRQDVFFAIDGISEIEPACPFLRINSDHQSVWQVIHMLEKNK